MLKEDPLFFAGSILMFIANVDIWTKFSHIGRSFEHFLSPRGLWGYYQIKSVSMKINKTCQSTVSGEVIIFTYRLMGICVISIDSPTKKSPKVFAFLREQIDISSCRCEVPIYKIYRSLVSFFWRTLHEKARSGFMMACTNSKQTHKKYSKCFSVNGSNFSIWSY